MVWNLPNTHLESLCKCHLKIFYQILTLLPFPCFQIMLFLWYLCYYFSIIIAASFLLLMFLLLLLLLFLFLFCRRFSILFSSSVNGTSNIFFRYLEVIIKLFLVLFTTPLMVVI